MNITEILGDNRKYTFHSHSQFCDGRATMDEFAREAVARGFTHYGFSPHSPVPIASPCNMGFDDVAPYLAEVERIRSVYGDKVNFYAGMEIDYLGPQWGPSSEYFRNLGLDFAIGSVHFIPDHAGNLVDIDGRFDSFRMKMERHFDNDIRYVVETFYRCSIEMIAAGGFDIIGHFDKVGQNASYWQPGIEDTGWYRDLADGLTESIIASGVIVEINTKAFVEHDRLFPNPRHLKHLVEAGVPIIVNSDAHVPALIDASRDVAFSIIDSL